MVGVGVVIMVVMMLDMAGEDTDTLHTVVMVVMEDTLQV
jgi:hypothetical protein